MAELKLQALDEALTADQLSVLTRKLAESGVDDLPDSDESVELDEALTEDQLTDFMDRLEAHDIACDMYIPAEFEGRIEIGEMTFGSAHALAEALEEIREELDLDEDGESEDEEDVDLEMIEEQLGHAWRAFSRAVAACIERQIALHVVP